MRKIILFFAASVMLLSLPTQLLAKDHKVKKAIRVSLTPQMLSLTEEQGMVHISFMINVPSSYVHSKHQYQFTPVLTDFDNAIPLTSVIIDGKKYAKMAAKGGHNKYMQNKMSMAPDMSEAIKLMATKNSRIVKYELKVPYEDWMEGANLIIFERFNSRSKTVLIAEDIYAKGIKRTTPKVRYEMVKEVMMMEGEIELEFAAGSSKIDLNLANNSEEFKKMHTLLHETIGNKNITIDSVNIIASSSPEGNFAYNEMLATARAMSIKNHLSKDKDMPQEMIDKIHIKCIAENWEGLDRLVMASDVPNKADVMKAITIPNLQMREKAMMALPEYGYIKKNLLPHLRFVKYQIYCHTMMEVAIPVIMKNNASWEKSNETITVTNEENMHIKAKDKRDKKRDKVKLSPREERYNR